MEQRKALELCTTTRIRLVAIWKPKMDRWYIFESAGNEGGNLKNVIDKLTPRQFQEAVEDGQYSFSW